MILCSGVFLFALSLALPALAVLDKPLFGGGATPKVYPGVLCLLMGWILLPGWLANPLFFASTLLHGLGKHRVAIVLLVLALLSALIAPVMLTHSKDIELRYLHVGYYVWVVSLVVMLVGASRSALRDVDRRLAMHHSLHPEADAGSRMSTRGHGRP